MKLLMFAILAAMGMAQTPIPLQATPAPPYNLMDQMLKRQQILNLQREAELRAAETRRIQIENGAAEMRRQNEDLTPRVPQSPQPAQLAPIYTVPLPAGEITAEPFGSIQTRQDIETDGMMNGRAWSAMSEPGKQYFIAGFGEALAAATADADSETKEPAYFAGAKNGEVVKGLNQFYQDPANAAIPIAGAMMVLADKVKGWLPDDLANFTAELRRIAAAARTAPPAAK